MTRDRKDVDKQSVTACLPSTGRRPAGRNDDPGWQRRDARVGSGLAWRCCCGRSGLPPDSLAGLKRQLLGGGRGPGAGPAEADRAGKRRDGTTRGKQDTIDALAMRRAALRETDLSRAASPTSSATQRSSARSTILATT